MPSKPTLTLANAYTLIVESGNLSDPNVRWRNTWDIHATVTPQPSDAIISDITNFHLYNLRTDAGVFQLTLRNWSQGPQPFADRPFLWEHILGGTAGLKTNASPHGYGGQFPNPPTIPGAAVAFAKRLTSGQNKATNMFMRGLLDDDDIRAETGGKYTFFTGNRVTPALFHDIVSAVLTPYLGSGANPGLILVHVGNHSAGPAFSSPMVDLQLIGPSINKTTRKNKR